MATKTATRQLRKAARWARWSVLAGTVLMLLSGASLVTVDRLVARYEGAVHHEDLFGDKDPAKARVTVEPKPIEDLKGPLNILLAGIDPRHSDPYWIPRADSVLVMHIPAGLDRGYLFSLPRDLLVPIPAFPKSNYGGSASEKLAHAMFFGAQVPGDRRANYAQGFELLAAAVSGYTGIPRFDAGAIVNFSGFRHIIDALDGIDVDVDEQVVSIHMQPDGEKRKPGRSPNGYVGPQMTYEPGRQHLNGWQALDFARQRYIADGDYGRQRHQQQVIRAMVNKGVSGDVLSDPIKLDKVLRAAGDSVTFSGRGYSMLDWAFALREIRPENIVMVKLLGGGVGRWVEDKDAKSDDGDKADDGDEEPKGDDAKSDDKADKDKKEDKPKKKYQYLGEQLDYPSRTFLTSVADGTVEQFLFMHPEMLQR
ncbi:LCP family protein [Catellatospora sp. KI3]|uniref:LCP family protein n=1 Tax=Catellatospora sp. KI3 TaxID=3041620 RepID=UPI0024831279|nr:LCP family protein [Catellatospora sp. KI3]MDI1459673.1 LCP family protein [Catellatospora sp. KI3]